MKSSRTSSKCFSHSLVNEAVTDVCKAIFRYANGDPSNTDAFLCIAREHIKPYVDESWMPWCEELIADISLPSYERETGALRRRLRRYNMHEIEAYTDGVIKTLLQDHSDQRGFFANGAMAQPFCKSKVVI